MRWSDFYEKTPKVYLCDLWRVGSQGSSQRRRGETIRHVQCIPTTIYFHNMGHMKHWEYRLCSKIEKKNKVKSSKLPNLGLNRKKQEKVPLPPHHLAEILLRFSKLQKHVVPMPMSTADYIITFVSTRVPWEESILSELETCFVYVRNQTTVQAPFSVFKLFHIYNGWIRGWVSLKLSYVFIHKTFE